MLRRLLASVRSGVVKTFRCAALLMNKWHTLLLVVPAVIANCILISFAARGFFGRSDPMLFLLLALIWCVYVGLDATLTAKSPTPHRWPVAIVRIAFACVGAYVNLSAVSQIMYVS